MPELDVSTRDLLAAASSTSDGHLAVVLPTLIVVLALGIVFGVWPTALFTSRKALLLGADGRLSTSKAVAFVWTLFVVWVFASTILIALISGGSTLQLENPTSDQYLLLLGGPFAGLVAAKAIVTSRLANGTLQKSQSNDPISPADLISNDVGDTDLVDLQFTLFNLIALGWYAVAFFQNSTADLPHIPAGLAGLTSVSALTYMGNKAVQQSTPRIISLDPTAQVIGGEVTIHGSRLLAQPDTDGGVTPGTGPVITVGGIKVEPLESPPPTDTMIAIRVPHGVSLGQVDVALTTGTSANATGSDTATLIVLPDKAPQNGQTVPCQGTAGEVPGGTT